LKEGFDRQLFRVLKIAPEMNYRTAKLTAQIHKDVWYTDTNGQVAGDAGTHRDLTVAVKGLVVDAADVDLGRGHAGCRRRTTAAAR